MPHEAALQERYCGIALHAANAPIAPGGVDVRVVCDFTIWNRPTITRLPRSAGAIPDCRCTDQRTTGNHSTLSWAIRRTSA